MEDKKFVLPGSQSGGRRFRDNRTGEKKRP